MITIVQYATNVYMRLFPAWNHYFKHSEASWSLDRAAAHLYKRYTDAASFRSRGKLTPPQAEAIAILVARSRACMREAQFAMTPITREELKP